MGPLVLLMSLIGCGARPQKGSQAPDFTLYDLQEKSVQLSQINQQSPVLLIFWATWCPSCVEEIPELNRLHQTKRSDGLKILAVNVQESQTQIKDFLKKNSIHYPIVLDSTGEVAEKYGIVGLPASVLLAKGGEILYYGFSLPHQIKELS